MIDRMLLDKRGGASRACHTWWTYQLCFLVQGNVYDDDEEYGDTLDDGDNGAIY